VWQSSTPANHRKSNALWSVKVIYCSFFFMDDDIILLLSEGPDKCVSSNTDLDKCGSFDILDGSTVQTPTVTSILRLTVRKSPSMPNCAIFVDCSPCFVSAFCLSTRYISTVPYSCDFLVIPDL
jgi:hypothetical protein